MTAAEVPYVPTDVESVPTNGVVDEDRSAVFEARTCVQILRMTSALDDRLPAGTLDELDERLGGLLRGTFVPTIGVEVDSEPLIVVGGLRLPVPLAFALACRRLHEYRRLVDVEHYNDPLYGRVEELLAAVLGEAARVSIESSVTLLNRAVGRRSSSRRFRRDPLAARSSQDVFSRRAGGYETWGSE